MAQSLGRMRRDFTNEEEYNITALPRRSESLNQALSPSNTSRSFSAEHIVNDEKLASYRDYGVGIGIAQTSDEDDTTTEGGNDTQGEEDTEEPVLHEAQMDAYEMDNTVPSIDVVHADINRKSAFSPSLTSMSRTSEDPSSGSSSNSRTKMPEFFGHAVFQTALHNPTISHQLLEFAQSRLCGENLEFLNRVNKYHILLGDVSKVIVEIHKEFISNAAPSQINLPEQVLLKANADMRTSLTSTLPLLESVFVSAQSDIERLVYTDIYPKFVRNQMTLSAAKALGTDRTRYAGLGDCFVLTDPAKADNPIVHASDGFVKVTGYSRSEIIPRNCRFLQNRHTDRAAVRRLRAAIDKREESVELLLNQKKNGEPFWNLLYTTPLYDVNGRVVFFLGGQINCSTTIHSASDVLRILAQTREKPEDTAPAAMAPIVVQPPVAKSLLSAFRSKSKMNIQQRTPGMENVLLDQIGELDLKKQMHSFYSAYSNFIVVNYSTFLISFLSGGITDLLFPIKAKSQYHAQAVGTDVFKFLANHGSGSLGWEFKSSVKGALKMGQPISLDLKLCARPYMGFEKFTTHWTPLKNEASQVSWIVLTLGSDTRV